MLALDKISNGELDKLQEIDGHEPTFHLIAGGAPNPDHDPHIFSGKLLAEEGEGDSDSEDAGGNPSLLLLLLFSFLSFFCLISFVVTLRWQRHDASII